MTSRALMVPGIRSIDLSGPFSAERRAFNESRDKIQGALIKFPLASAVLSPNERVGIAALMPDVQQVLNAPADLHGNVVLEIVGHSDDTGAETTNQTLSQRRAERVVAELKQLGCPPRSVRARGVATAEPLQIGGTEGARQMNRSVTIRVVVASVR
jgi:outer membrane protein OmpA-like peptidoglycan-associated protein